MTLGAPVSGQMPHGIRRYKHGGCKCGVCRAANARDQNLWRLGRKPRLIDPTGTRRRLQGLLADGWTYVEVATAVGRSVHGSWVSAALRTTRVRSDVADDVRRAFDQLSMRPEPQGTYRDRGRANAARKGWARSWAWDDDEIDDPKAKPRKGSWAGKVPPDMAVVIRFVDHGERPPRHLSRAEAQIAYRWLKERGFSDHEIEKRWHMKTERYGNEEAKAS